jgi:alpha-glucan,water dikinase
MTLFLKVSKDSPLFPVQGQHVSLDVTPAGDVSVTQVDPPSDTSPSSSSNGSRSSPRLNLSPPQQSHAWAIPEQQFAPGVVGGKAHNLKTLRLKLPDWIAVPASVALPFGTFERVLGHHVNGGVAGRLHQLQEEVGRAQVGAGVPKALHEARHLVTTQLQAPDELVSVSDMGGTGERALTRW